MGDLSSSHLDARNAIVSEVLAWYLSASGTSPKGRLMEYRAYGIPGMGFGKAARYSKKPRVTSTPANRAAVGNAEVIESIVAWLVLVSPSGKALSTPALTCK